MTESFRKVGPPPQSVFPDIVAPDGNGALE